ncbi:hypothetical protein Lal_00040797 [Lupinus albus]|nr:hypothetical protein Lal_00040797 [Lupinus albus]
MTTELLQIHPPQLKFIFELKKQSSCLIQLQNKADHFVAFKVKTTSPKKYCVRPNIGIIKPKDTCDFTVIMQAQKTAPPDLICKDKFLIQCTAVPFGVTEHDITSDVFAKDSGKYIEEKKLNVVLITPPSSPVLLPVNGDVKQDSSNEIHLQKDRAPGGVENIPPPIEVSSSLSNPQPQSLFPLLIEVSEEGKGLKTAQDTEEDRTAEDIVTRHAENVSDMKPSKDGVQLTLAKDLEELRSRLGIMDSKLREAEATIMKLNEERHTNTEEKDLILCLRQGQWKKLVEEALKRKMDAKRAQAGFPLLFVCMVALVSVVAGYYIHP